MRDITCPICSKVFQHWQARAKYCCRKCANQSAYHKTKKVVLDKGYQLQKRYGISVEQFEQMIENQHGCCAICTDTMIKPYVDHSHDKGHVRGLLCMKCNSALGLLKENVNSISNMIRYLEDDIKAQRERS